MGLFGFGKKGNEGGLMDAIRCDEKDFLIWKWRPEGQDVNTTRKENAIRTGSSLNVRPGQAAIFLYPNTSGQYDVIFGPYNDVIKTDNMPVLANIIGAAYAGGTPFQAEIYFINLAMGMEIPFTVPFFRVVPSEPEYKAYNVEVAIDGTLVFQASRTPENIKYLFEAWGGNDTTLEEFEEKVQSRLIQDVKQVVANAPKDTGIFVMHFNSLIGEMGPYILARLRDQIMNRFGLIPTDITINDIRYDEDSPSYQALMRITEGQAHLFNLEKEKTALLSHEIERTTMATDANIRNMSASRMADIQLDHQEAMLGAMREEAQYAQHMQTDVAGRRADLASQTDYIGAHQINVQADVMKTGLSNMGNMGSMNLGGGEGHMNPAGMMTSMMMGTAVAGQMGNMMNNMGGTLNQQMQQQQMKGATPPPMPGAPTPPPMQPQAQVYVNVNGQQYGPLDMPTLTQMAQAGQVNAQTMAWMQGMPAWAAMGTIPALAGLFQQTPPPMGGPTPPPIG